MSGAFHRRLVTVVERRTGAKVFLGHLGVVLRDGRRGGGLGGRRGWWSAQLDHTRRRRIEPEVEFVLPLPGRHQRPDHTPKRAALCERVVRVFDESDIGKREKRVGIRAKDWPQEPALHEIPQMIFTKLPIPCEKVAHGVVLPLQRLRRRHLGNPAELLFRYDPDLQILGTFQLVAFFVRRRNESFRAHDDQCRLCIDLVAGGAAEAGHERARVAAAERAEFAGEDDELSRERLRGVGVRRG